MAPKSKKQKLEQSDELEVEYEKDTSNKIEPSRINLLPIKTKTGIITHSIIKKSEGKHFFLFEIKVFW